MQHIIPGTVIQCQQGVSDKAFSQIEPVFSITGGLTLAQVCDITGLETSTIQNWVRRGWVPQPENKRYSKRSLLRIMLINSVRGSLQIEKIACLMEYINGNVEDTGDDIISDEDLFNMFCKIVFKMEPKHCYSAEHLKLIISESLEGYEEKEAGSKQRLQKALYVMALAFVAARIRELSNKEFEDNIKQHVAPI